MDSFWDKVKNREIKRLNWEVETLKHIRDGDLRHIEEAIQLEREACAKVADSLVKAQEEEGSRLQSVSTYRTHRIGAGLEIAKAIRERQNTP